MIDWVEISEFDKDALKIIRMSVDAFLKECAEKYNKGLLLEIGPNGIIPYFDNVRYHTLDIDPSIKADFHADITKKTIIKSNTYHIILCTEVLEHVSNPFKAIKEIYRILRDGGVLLLTTPFNFRIHGPFPDCWRFTHFGLKELLKEFSHVEIETVKTEGREMMPLHYRVIAIK